MSFVNLDFSLSFFVVTSKRKLFDTSSPFPEIPSPALIKDWLENFASSSWERPNILEVFIFISSLNKNLSWTIIFPNDCPPTEPPLDISIFPSVLSKLPLISRVPLTICFDPLSAFNNFLFILSLLVPLFTSILVIPSKITVLFLVKLET